MSPRRGRTGSSHEPRRRRVRTVTYYRLALLGDPVDHSRSPEIQGAMLDVAGLDGEYKVIRADEQVLQDTVQALRSGDWQGLNVTMPLKGAAARAADRLTPQASTGESVNTLTIDSGEVLGHSTDADAFVQLVSSDRFPPDAPLLVLGAGGSAAAALAALGASHVIYMAARRPVSAETLIGRFGGQAVAWGTPVPGAILINCTPLGMHGESLPGPVLDAAVGLIDLPYGPEDTPAIVQSRASGIAAADGHEFLLRQAIASFAMWTGVDLPLASVAERLRKV